MEIVVAVIVGGAAGAISGTLTVWLIGRSKWYKKYCEWVMSR
jgi:hypothetical protein